MPSHSYESRSRHSHDVDRHHDHRSTTHKHHSHKERSKSRTHHEDKPKNTLRETFSLAVRTLVNDPKERIAATGELKSATELLISNLPDNITPNQLQTAVNLLMANLKLTTAPGHPCTNTWISSDGKSASIEFRTVKETNNALALDGLNIFNRNVSVTRPKTYNGPETEAPQVDPELLLELVTGADAMHQYKTLKSMGENMLLGKNDKKMNIQMNTMKISPTVPNEEELKLSYDIEKCILIQNIPRELEEFEIRNICDPFGEIKNLFLLKKDGEFQGEAVVEYESALWHDIAMEGLEGLPMDSPTNSILLHVSKPSPKWPAFPIPVSTISKPSPVLRVGNILSIEDIEEEEDYEDLKEDLNTEFGKLGTILSMEIPRPKNGQKICDGLGYVFLQYSSLQESSQATRELRTKTFNGQQLHVEYYPEDLYIQKNYGPAGELI
ncbi:hypothetical protein WA158_003627 [Blastocystis sp. Blastoise]